MLNAYPDMTVKRYKDAMVFSPEAWKVSQSICANWAFLKSEYPAVQNAVMAAADDANSN